MDCNSRRAHLCLGSSPPSPQHKGPVVNESVRNIDNPSDEADAKTSETIPQCSDIFVLRKNVNPEVITVNNVRKKLLDTKGICSYCAVWQRTRTKFV